MEKAETYNDIELRQIIANQDSLILMSSFSIYGLATLHPFHSTFEVAEIQLGNVRKTHDTISREWVEKTRTVGRGYPEKELVIGAKNPAVTDCEFLVGELVRRILGSGIGVRIQNHAGCFNCHAIESVCLRFV